MSVRSFWSVLELEFESRNARTRMGGVAELLVFLTAALLALLGRPLPAYLRLLFAAGAVGILVYEGLAVRRLKRLAQRGVEVEAELVDVEDESAGTEDFRYMATYSYDYGGQSYQHHEPGGTPKRATRFGERVRLLVDPERPRISLLVGAADKPPSDID